MSNKQKLELTWIGKDNRPRLEPRILLEDPEKSYHAPHRVTENDIFDNRLIFGDNLLALKALEQEFAGKIKCIFIDPPYNTGSAFEHYDDGIEHSLWLSLMRDRLEIIKRLLMEDGSLWITIDDNEGHYLKIVCDEIFGRRGFISNVIWRTSDSSNNNVTQFSLDHNSILVYSNNAEWKPKFLDDPKKRSHYKNPDNDPKGPWFEGHNLQNPGLRPNLQYNITGPNGDIIKHPPNGWRWSWDTIQEKMKIGEIRFSDDGKRIIRRTYLKDQEGLPPSTLWVDLDETGHNRQAKYELKNLFPDVAVTSLFGTPKPERLLGKIIDVSTNPGDLVLDSFAGSGTTGAVAHKMGRRWIMVELGEHCHTHIIPRMKKVIDGTDQGGISKMVPTHPSVPSKEGMGWKGGGGFRYFRLAPSLLEKDKWGNWVISKEYDATMLASAMAKHEGFVYNPDETFYWKQGKSTEKDYIFTTTNFITMEYLDSIHEEMQPDESLLICCKSFQEACEDRYDNITIKKIPNLLLGRCEFGKEDYSFNIANELQSGAESVDDKEHAADKKGKTGKKKGPANQPTLFDEED